MKKSSKPSGLKSNEITGKIYFAAVPIGTQIQTKFIQYLDLVASKVAKEKKLIYLMGDFNFDLLQYDTDNNSYDFLNSIVENGMLLFIHQPTRLIDSSATLIDNIFSNNIEDESISGNLFIKLSDHLPQFLIINRTEDRLKGQLKRRDKLISITRF